MIDTQPTLLLIHPEGAACDVARQQLNHAGFRVRLYTASLPGLAQALQGKFTAIILDLSLAGFHGHEAIHHIRRRCSAPILCIAETATHGIAALNGGADDYVVKDLYAMEELTARVSAVLRRMHYEPMKPNEILVGGLRINSASRSVIYRDSPIRLTSMEFDLLELLTRSAGRVVSRDEIATILNQRTATPFERAIDVHISRLRKKLRANLIRSIRGVGYLLQPVGLSPLEAQANSRPQPSFEGTGFLPALQFSSPAA